MHLEFQVVLLATVITIGSIAYGSFSAGFYGAWVGFLVAISLFAIIAILALLLAVFLSRLLGVKHESKK